MSHKVLVVEDNATLLDTLDYNLSRQDYQVVTASNGLTALETARNERPDLIILDLMLPGLDGIEVCRILRQETIAPVLMLTARTSEADKVVGLEVGADDYVTKPFSMREFLARVKALLRRANFMHEELASQADRRNPTQLDLGDLVIDQVRCEVTLNGKPLRLKPKEYDLLVFLALNRGIALSRDLILERVWSWDFDGGSRTVDVHMRWLREKIEADPANPMRIVTVRGVGYRFET
ncbi:MAG: response regulator transcription factor [Anaerolineae bacterium]|nr:response regulator transcription factor [Anaerolineae bacterium]